jgi:hypothetical protein
LHWDIEVTPKDEDEMIGKIALKIHQYGLDVAAILMLESVKPLSYIGSQMGLVFASPFLPFLGETVSITGEKFLKIFEKRENVEKLIKAVEDLTRKEKELKKAEKSKMAEGGDPERKGWRRFLPF